MKTIAAPLALVLLTAASCSDASTRNSTAAAPKKQPSPIAARPVIFPMGTGVIELPTGCTASCENSIDFSAGKIACPQFSRAIEYYAGPDGSVGLYLDDSGATIQGQETLSSGARLRWGVTNERRFSVDITQGIMRAELYSVVNTDERRHLTDIVRTYRSRADSPQPIGCKFEG